MVWKWRGAVDTVVKLDISNLRVLSITMRGKLKSVAELRCYRTIHHIISVDIIELDIVSALAEI